MPRRIRSSSPVPRTRQVAQADRAGRSSVVREHRSSRPNRPYQFALRTPPSRFCRQGGVREASSQLPPGRSPTPVETRQPREELAVGGTSHPGAKVTDPTPRRRTSRSNLGAEARPYPRATPCLCRRRAARGRGRGGLRRERAGLTPPASTELYDPKTQKFQPSGTLAQPGPSPPSRCWRQVTCSRPAVPELRARPSPPPSASTLRRAAGDRPARWRAPGPRWPPPRCPTGMFSW